MLTYTCIHTPLFLWDSERVKTNVNQSVLSGVVFGETAKHESHRSPHHSPPPAQEPITAN